MSDQLPEPSAVLKMKLSSNTGYRSESTFDNVTPDQWGAINKVLHSDIDTVKKMMKGAEVYNALRALTNTCNDIKAEMDAALPRNTEVSRPSARLTWPLSTALAALELP